MAEYVIASNGELMHFGVKGMKWGIRRYQNEDGSLTEKGRKRAAKGVKKQEKIRSRQETIKEDTSYQKERVTSATKNRQSINAEKLTSTVEKNRIDRKLAVDDAGQRQYLTRWGKRRDQDKSFQLNARLAELEDQDLKERARIADAVEKMNINDRRLSDLDAKYEKIGRKYLTDLIKD